MQKRLSDEEKMSWKLECVVDSLWVAISQTIIAKPSAQWTKHTTNYKKIQYEKQKESKTEQENAKKKNICE